MALRAAFVRKRLIMAISHDYAAIWRPMIRRRVSRIALCAAFDSQSAQSRHNRILGDGGWLFALRAADRAGLGRVMDKPGKPSAWMDCHCNRAPENRASALRESPIVACRIFRLRQSAQPAPRKPAHSQLPQRPRPNPAPCDPREPHHKPQSQKTEASQCETAHVSDGDGRTPPSPLG